MKLKLKCSGCKKDLKRAKKNFDRFFRGLRIKGPRIRVRCRKCRHKLF